MKIVFVFNYVVSKQPSVEMFNSSEQKTFARLQNHVEYFRNSKKNGPINKNFSQPSAQ